MTHFETIFKSLTPSLLSLLAGTIQIHFSLFIIEENCVSDFSTLFFNRKIEARPRKTYLSKYLLDKLTIFSSLVLNFYYSELRGTNHSLIVDSWHRF